MDTSGCAVAHAGEYGWQRLFCNWRGRQPGPGLISRSSTETPAKSIKDFPASPTAFAFDPEGGVLNVGEATARCAYDLKRGSCDNPLSPSPSGPAAVSRCGTKTTGGRDGTRTGGWDLAKTQPGHTGESFGQRSGITTDDPQSGWTVAWRGFHRQYPDLSGGDRLRSGPHLTHPQGERAFDCIR